MSAEQPETTKWHEYFPGPTLIDFLDAAQALGMKAWDADVMDIGNQRRIEAEAALRGVVSIEGLAAIWRMDHGAGDPR